MRSRQLFHALAAATAVATWVAAANAQHPNGASLVRLLRDRAKDVFAPRHSPGMGALVRLPTGVRAADVGLDEIAPGFGRLWGTPASIVAYGAAHPDLPIEVSPPLHMLLDTAAGYVRSRVANASGFDGSNVLVGIADTGVDLTHPNFQDASGGTRVQWLLDLSSPPIGKYPDLEQKYGSTDANGNLAYGAVWAKSDIDAALSAGATSGMPKDEIGHGTLVASCAAGQDPRYQGVAPHAGLLVARVADADGDIGNDEMLRGVGFLFDRADSLSQPVVVNLSLGSDFGPHDGTTSWEQTLASHVGSGQPGHALVVAAGNSGSIADTPIHQSLYVSRGVTMRVPILTDGAQDGGVQVWVTMHAGAQLGVGLDGPDGTWISPVGQNDSAGKNTPAYNAAIYNGSEVTGSPVPAQSSGAVVVWQGAWPKGTYFVTLSGIGTADLYVEGNGDASVASVSNVGFADAVRESTIGLPATHPAIISVGCTINKTSWDSLAGPGVGFPVPMLDAVGGEPIPNAVRDPIDGEPCWFSSAGPTLTGLPKPEIMAPGAAIVGAMSQQALPPGPASIFTGGCPADSTGAVDPRCNEVDAEHGAALGTSFSAPLVSGAVALLFQQDPTLTQDDVVAALQAGAHPLREAVGPQNPTPPFDDQSGAGELDVVGSLAAAESLRNPPFALPSRSVSWMTLGADVYLADGSLPLEAVLELRSAPSGAEAPMPADGFEAGRLAAYAVVNGSRADVPVRRTAPGVWVVTECSLSSGCPWGIPTGLGGLRLTVGATFDGVDIVDPKSVPIATDEWLAEYPPRAMGGCAVSATGPATGVGAWLVAASLAAVSIAKRGHEKSRARPTIQWRRFFSPLAEPKIRAHITVVLSASQMPAIRRPQLHLASRTSETYPEDQELAEALIGGQSWAATATYQKHGSMVYRFLHRTLGTSEEAEDMTQEVFLQVFSNVRTLRNPQALRSFIFSVAIRTLKWELRRRRIRRFFHVSDFDQVPEPAVSALDAESRQAVRRLYAILDRLTAQERAAFVLRHVEQLKLEEVAQALEVSLATVKRRLERAVRIVSREMEQDPSLAPYSKRMTYDKHGRGQNEAS